jgi:hypothetical protein
MKMVLIALLKETGSGRVGKTVPFRYNVEPFDIGRDTVSAVSKELPSAVPPSMAA